MSNSQLKLTTSSIRRNTTRKLPCQFCILLYGCGEKYENNTGNSCLDTLHYAGYILSTLQNQVKHTWLYHQIHEIHLVRRPWDCWFKINLAGNILQKIMHWDIRLDSILLSYFIGSTHVHCFCDARSHITIEPKAIVECTAVYAGVALFQRLTLYFPQWIHLLPMICP